MTQSLLPNIVQFVGQIDPFDKVPKEALRELSNHIQIVYLAKGEVIDLCLEGQDKSFNGIRRITKESIIN
ncbi:hypothetical protein HGG78_06495 [Vibrio aestuarianus]|nr:hypothetical protein [Vibrio aestuarianus]NGZ13396.1 hypothetical protein [Vibrio aestuarianus]NKZ49544.1 hypothetical protein [Vibrio aestuarianus]